MKTFGQLRKELAEAKQETLTKPIYLNSSSNSNRGYGVAIGTRSSSNDYSSELVVVTNAKLDASKKKIVSGIVSGVYDTMGDNYAYSNASKRADMLARDAQKAGVPHDYATTK
ncbi:MAG: hypothetical protein BV459_00585 [Thermoplasmata archaeon M11B2D]|nr:MAG: hypothetical protein BV459_00585 [Thermoplasmata archaeon M11B2D]